MMSGPHVLGSESEDALRRICERLLRMRENAIYLQFLHRYDEIPFDLNPSSDSDPLASAEKNQILRTSIRLRAGVLGREKEVDIQFDHIDKLRESIQKSDSDDIFWALNDTLSTQAFDLLPPMRHRGLSVANQASLGLLQDRYRSTLRAVHEAKTWPVQKREALVDAMQTWKEQMDVYEVRLRQWYKDELFSFTVDPDTGKKTAIKDIDTKIEPLLIALQETEKMTPEVRINQAVNQSYDDRMTPLGLLSIQQEFVDWASTYLNQRTQWLEQIAATWRGDSDIPEEYKQHAAEMLEPLHALRQALKSDALDFYRLPPPSLGK